MDSSLEHFARTVAPRDWKNVLICMLTACFDGAGKDFPQDDVLCVAGFSGFAKVWGDDFEPQWLERLSKDGLTCFHAVDFAQSRRQFADWKGDTRRRNELSADLMAVVENCGLRKFGCVIRIADYRSVLKKHGDKHPEWPLFDPYAIPAMFAVESFLQYARSEGIKRNVRYVFEKGDPETTLRQYFRAHGYHEPDFAGKTKYVDRKGFERDPFIGLQVADSITYEYYLDAVRWLKSEPNDRWPYRQFERLQGSIDLKYRRFASTSPDVISDELGQASEQVRLYTEYLQRIKSSHDNTDS